MYNQVYRTTLRIEKCYSWQQIYNRSHLDESDLHDLLKYLISESHGTIKIVSSDTSNSIIFDFVDRKMYVDYYLISSIDV